MKRCRMIIAAAVALALMILAPTNAAGPFPIAKLPVAKVRFEQNATDSDVEVVFEVTGRSDGLKSLTILAPDGRTVADFAAHADGSTLGIRQFVFESPEPTDVAGLKAAYPEGKYTFVGMTTGGTALHGEATLSHQLPATTTFGHPGAEAENVGIRDLAITWSPTEDSVAYVVELEADGSDASLKAVLPGTATRFAVPNGFLRPGSEYQLGIGTVSAEGNLSFVETSFTTADNE